MKHLALLKRVIGFERMEIDSLIGATRPRLALNNSDTMQIMSNIAVRFADSLRDRSS